MLKELKRSKSLVAAVICLLAISQNSFAQTLQELGWVNFPYGAYSSQPKGGATMWVASKSAFRTAESVQDDTIYVDDNSFMGWALSKTSMYSWSANQYAPALRNYLISMTVDSSAPLINNGASIYSPSAGPEFYKGHTYLGSTWTLMVNDKNTDPSGITYPKLNGSDSAIVSFAPSLAMVSITKAYPSFVSGGIDNTAWLYAHIDRILSHQNEITLHVPSISSGQDKRLGTASMAMHMLASLEWYQFRSDPKYLTFVKNAWDKIKLRQNNSAGSPFLGAMVDFGDPNSTGGNYSVLRHTQILAAMAHTYRAIGDYNGLNAALIKASNALKTVQSQVSCSGSWTISQGFYLGNNACANDGYGGLGYPPAFREITITDGFAYLGQICHGAPQAQVALRANGAARRNLPFNGTGDFFNTFAGNRTIPNGVFVESAPTNQVNDPLFLGGTLEANAMVWLAKWWQAQPTGC